MNIAFVPQGEKKKETEKKKKDHWNEMNTKDVKSKRKERHSVNVNVGGRRWAAADSWQIYICPLAQNIQPLVKKAATRKCMSLKSQEAK